MTFEQAWNLGITISKADYALKLSYSAIGISFFSLALTILCMGMLIVWKCGK